MLSNLRITQDKTALILSFDDASERSLSAAKLRDNAKDADALRTRIDGRYAGAEAGITITNVQPIGHTGVNIQFSDGHERAIYPFQYLVQLSHGE